MLDAPVEAALLLGFSKVHSQAKLIAGYSMKAAQQTHGGKSKYVSAK